MRKDYFIFGGVNSAEYGVILTEPATEDAPEREIAAVELPGRSGALLQDKGRFKNIKIAYLKLKEIIYTDNGVEKTAADSKFEMALTDDPEKNYIKVIYWAPWAET